MMLTLSLPAAQQVATSDDKISDEPSYGYMYMFDASLCENWSYSTNMILYNINTQIAITPTVIAV